jgi:hypothetical protein
MKKSVSLQHLRKNTSTEDFRGEIATSSPCKYSGVQTVEVPMADEKSLVILFSEKIMSILLHTNCMIIFELYFYFVFIIDIERELLLDKINDYFDNLEENYNENLTDEEKALAQHFVNVYPYDGTDLYNDYKDSQHEQSALLHRLFIKSIIIWSFYAFAYTLSLMKCLTIRNKINWSGVVLENMAMMLLLGLFEYIFFVHVILLYTPVTDAEIKYLAYDSIWNIVNSSAT